MKESDWKLFKKLSPWLQEKHMAKLNKEYIQLLLQDKPASSLFWELEKRIKQDKTSPGVILELARSKVVTNLVGLINDKVITFEDLNDLSDELKEEVKSYLDFYI